MDSENEVEKHSLRETVRNLLEPFPLQGPAVARIDHYWSRGFMLKAGAVSKAEIAAINVEDMKQRFVGSDQVKIVFNDNPVRAEEEEQPDSRQQIVTKEYEKYNRGFLSVEQRAFLDRCEAIARTTAREILRYKKPRLRSELKTVESLLYSKKENQDIQIPHRDLTEGYSELAVLCLLALEDDTTLLMAGGSHLIKPEASNPAICRYGLSAGDMVFFHPLLVHAGDAYHDSNIRVHYYVFHSSTNWKIDRTYHLTEDEEEDLRQTDIKIRDVNRLMLYNRSRSAARQTRKKVCAAMQAARWGGAGKNKKARGAP